MTIPIAFLGTGLLGSGFVEAALGRGESVRVWNRTRAKAEPLIALGATVCETAAEAVRGVSRVHLVLQDDASVDAVIEALRPGLHAEATIVDHTTTRPDLTASRAARLTAAGVRYLHCPVFIGPPGARKAEGVILACGPRDWFDAVHPALAQQASRIEYLGARPDIAAAFKLAGNALLLGITGLVSDTVTVLDRAGVPGADITKLLDYLNPSQVVAARAKRMTNKDFTPSFELAMARKDLRLMQESVGDAPLMVIPGMAARMDALLAEGLGHQDFGVIGRDAVRPAADYRSEPTR